MKKVLSVLLTFCFLISCFMITVSAYTIQNNGVDGLYIDINSAPYTTLAQVPTWGQYAYGPSGCAWFASARAKELTGANIQTIYSGSSWYNSAYSYFGFVPSSVPQGKSLACWENHVAVIEWVYGDSVTISEGGYTLGNSSTGYCVIRSVKISEIEAGNSLTGRFLGYVYLGVGDGAGSVPGKPSVSIDKPITPVVTDTIFSFNAPNALSLHLYIYYGTEKYFEGEFSPTQTYTKQFYYTGHYSCFIIAHYSWGDVESDWLGFDVIDKSYTITFDANGGSCSTTSQTIQQNAAYGALPVPTRSGYTFDGWYTDKTGGTKISSNTEFTLGNNQTLYAHWIPNHTHSYTSCVEQAPTCEQDGLMKYTCSCGSSYTRVISATGHTSSNWIEYYPATVNGDGFQYTECITCGTILETASISQLKCATPKLTSVTATAKGATVKWGAVEGADNYNVYRKTYNATTKKWSGWSRIKKGTTSTSFTDTTAKSGTYYRYTVIANNEAGSSKYDTTGLKIYFLATPKLTSIANNTGKVTVKWNKVSGATGYFVYRRTYNATTKTWGGWTRIAKTKSNAYNDTTAKSGVYYRYTVRAYYGSYTSYFNTTGLQTKFLATPTLKAATSTKAGVKVTWGKVSGSSGYYIYRKTYSGGEWTGWKRIEKVSGGSKVSYLDESTKPGVYYKYTVRAYSGNYASYYNGTGLKIKAKY